MLEVIIIQRQILAETGFKDQKTYRFKNKGNQKELSVKLKTIRLEDMRVLFRFIKYKQRECVLNSKI